MSEEEDFIHGFCTDCRNRMSDNWMMNNAFANSGLSPSCPICGGVVAIMDSRRAKKDIDKSQRDRGIPVVD
jgi:transcription initiation factor IIE alpha subunit